jgi:hypothetical protein
MHRRVSFLGVLALLASLQTSGEIGCPSADMLLPLDAPPEIGAVRFSDLRIAAWNGLDARFLLENRGNKEIDYLTVVLEYQTKSGVTMVHIHFGDGSDLSWESSNWRTEPLLYDYPTNLSIPDSKSWSADEYFFTATVNREGHLDEVGPIPGTPAVPSGTVAEGLKKLIFSPGLDKGKPRTSNLILRVKFIRPGVVKTAPERTVQESITSKPAVFISLYPRDSDEIDWSFSFGRGFGYTTTITHPEH